MMLHALLFCLGFALGMLAVTSLLVWATWWEWH